MQLLHPRPALPAMLLSLCALLHLAHAQQEQPQQKEQGHPQRERKTKCLEVENADVEQDYNPHFVGFLSQCSVRRFARVGSYDWL